MRYDTKKELTNLIADTMRGSHGEIYKIEVLEDSHVVAGRISAIGINHNYVVGNFSGEHLYTVIRESVNSTDEEAILKCAHNGAAAEFAAFKIKQSEGFLANRKYHQDVKAHRKQLAIKKVKEYNYDK